MFFSLLNIRASERCGARNPWKGTSLVIIKVFDTGKNGEIIRLSKSHIVAIDYTGRERDSKTEDLGQ